MKPCKLMTVATLVLTSAFAGPAWSQGTPEQRRACTPDVFRLCGSSIPDVDRITACLVSRQQELSEACASVMSFSTARSTSSGASPARAPYGR